MNRGMSLYMALEVVTGDYGVKVDYFSFGCILYEIFELAKSSRRQSHTIRMPLLKSLFHSQSMIEIT